MVASSTSCRHSRESGNLSDGGNQIHAFAEVTGLVP